MSASRGLRGSNGTPPRAGRHGHPRRGAILPLVGLLLVVLLTILAIVVDLGQMMVYRAQLQGAADVAALAGVAALGDDNLIRPIAEVNQTQDLAVAQAQATRFAQVNAVGLNGAVKVVVNAKSDIDGGTLTNPDDLSQPMVASKSAACNSLCVRTYADASHSGNLSFLFAPIFGVRSTTIQMSATATVEVRKVASFRPLTGLRAPILPITMSFADWTAMVNNNTGVDVYGFDTTSGKIVGGPDGLDEQQLYPSSDQSSSNKGLLQFGVSSHSNSVLSDQIVNGPTSSQLLDQWPTTGGSPAWSAQHTLQIGADPGWRAANFDDLAAVAAAGLPRLIPINDGTNPGNGANGVYTIVAFAPVRVVVSIKGGSSSGFARVQPAVMDPTGLVAGGLAGPGEGGVAVVRLTR